MLLPDPIELSEDLLPLVVLEGTSPEKAERARTALERAGAQAILEDVWAVHEDTDTRAIDNFIVRLRRYLEDDPSTPKHLLTVRGIGYRFVSAP